MKKGYFVIMLALFLLVTGCGTSEGKDVSLEAAKEVYSKLNDSTIKHCVTEYRKSDKSVLRVFCVNSDKKLYMRNNESYAEGDKYYDTWYGSYERVYKSVKTPEEGYIAYEFTPSDLK